MAEKQCINGHTIDASWDLCPFCPVIESPPAFSVVRPRTLAVPLEPPAPAQSPAPSAAQSSAPAPAPTARQERTPLPSRINTGLRTAVLAKMSASGPRYVVGWLVALNGKARGESFPIRIGRNVIGRDRKAEVYIDDDQVSAHHADLVFRPDERRYILMDANSTNGTFINEEEIQSRSDLIAEDILRFGTQRYIFMPLCRDGLYWEDEGLLK